MTVAKTERDKCREHGGVSLLVVDALDAIAAAIANHIERDHRGSAPHDPPRPAARDLARSLGYDLPVGKTLDELYAEVRALVAARDTPQPCERCKRMA